LTHSSSRSKPSEKPKYAFELNVCPMYIAGQLKGSYPRHVPSRFAVTESENTGGATAFPKPRVATARRNNILKHQLQPQPNMGSHKLVLIFRGNNDVT
jgi:hypothetical protein